MMTETEKNGLDVPSREIVERIINECFESEGMKKHLIAHPEVLSAEKLRDIIAGAMIPLSAKAELMKDVDSFAYQDMRKALEALNNMNDKFFILSEERNTIGNGVREKVSEYIGPFIGLKMVRDYISEYYELPENGRLWENRLDINYWFKLERYEFVRNRELFNSYRYYMIGDEVCYFEKGEYATNNKYCKCVHYGNYSWNCLDLNISIPFEPGDIVTIDGRPFCEPKHALLLEVSDDCCGVRALYKKTDGSWDTGAVKHGTVYDCDWNALLSPLYRMERYIGKLNDDEKMLDDLSKSIDMSHYITYYIHKM